MRRILGLLVIGVAGLALWLWPDRHPTGVAAPGREQNRSLAGEVELMPPPEPGAGPRDGMTATGGEPEVPDPPSDALPKENPDPAEGRSGPISGFLIDARTDEPLPHYRIELSPEGPFAGTQLLETDALGFFQTTSVHTANPLEVWIDFLDDRTGLELEDRMRHFRAMSYDDQGEMQGMMGSSRWPQWSGRWKPGDPPLQVRWEVGPTYRLAFATPEGLGVEDFVAALTESPGERCATPQSCDAVFSGVRRGATPWVRFRHWDRNLHLSSQAWWIHLVSRDGRWAGRVRVPPAEGRAPGVHRVALEPQGRLRVRLTTSHPEGSDFFHMVLRTSDGATVARLDHPRLRGTREFELRGIPAGRYDFMVDAPRHAGFLAQVEIRAGADSFLDVPLVRVDEPATIRGTARSQTGTYTLRPDVVARHRITGRERRGRIEWPSQDEAGAWQGEFVIEGLDPGPHDLHVDDWDHWRWGPLEQSVVAPAEGVAFVARDGGERQFLRLEVRDGNGRELMGSTAILRFDGEREFTRHIGGFDSEMSMPVDSTLEWWVLATGYRPSMGTEARLEEYDRGRILRVTLEEGWGACLEVVTRAEDGSDSPLADCILRADGVRVAETDGWGFACFDLEKAPKKIQVQGHGIVGGGVDPDSGLPFESGKPTRVVVLPH